MRHPRQAHPRHTHPRQKHRQACHRRHHQRIPPTAWYDEHGLRWRPRVPPRDGRMFEADLNMGVFNIENEMAKRNASLTLADLKD